MKTWMTLLLTAPQLCIFASQQEIPEQWFQDPANQKPVQERWFRETIHNGWGQTFQVSKVLYEEDDGVVDLMIFENPLFGKVMVMDGAVQITEKDEYIYAEMMTHMPMFAHGDAQDVLIIGGGDGGTLREALKHPNLKSITLVEIDPVAVEFSRQHLSHTVQGAFDDPRTQIVIQDGSEFVKGAQGRYDVVICDSTDATGPAEVLYTEEFYADCKRALKPGGIFVNHCSVPFLQPEVIYDANKRLPKAFENVDFFIAAVPTYAGGFMAFSFASDTDYSDISVKQLQQRLASIKKPMRYYNAKIHKAAFALPEDLLESIHTAP